MAKKILTVFFAIFAIASTNDPSWALPAQSLYMSEAGDCGRGCYIQKDELVRLEQEDFKIPKKIEGYPSGSETTPGIIKRTEDPFTEFFRMSTELNRCL